MVDTSGGDKGGEGGKGTGDDGKGGAEDKGGVSSEQFDKLAEGITALASGMQSLQESHAKTNERMDALAKPPKPDDDDGDLDPGNKDLEEMSRADFANTIMDKVVKAVSKQIEQVTESVSAVRKDTGNIALEHEIEKLETANKDFWDWQDEIKVLANENPNTNLKRLYNMAKHENPDKLAELDKKYKANEDKGAGDDPKKKPFGGLTPTSSTTEHTEKMDKKTAADKAYEDTMGNMSFGGGD